jgi:hypothetical protein
VAQFVTIDAASLKALANTLGVPVGGVDVPGFSKLGPLESGRLRFGISNLEIQFRKSHHTRRLDKMENKNRVKRALCLELLSPQLLLP